MKASEIFDIPCVKGRKFGLEVECEGEFLPNIVIAQLTGYWSQVDDGSLRGRFPDQRSEYVSTGPLSLEEAVHSLNGLYSYAEANGTRWSFSFRTSFHVHVNITDLEEAQVLNIIYAYRLLESALFYKCKDTRKNNRFCLRANDSDHFIELCDRAFSQGINDIARHCNNEDLRYSSLNLASMRKHGTLEFRCKDASADVDNMIDWVVSLDKLVNWAISFKDPYEIFQFIQKNEKSLAFIVLGIDEDLKDFERDLSLSLQIPFLYREYAAKLKINAGEEVNI